MSEYGNTPWQFYVYGTYIIVALSILAYAFFSIRSRSKALKNLADEGFLHED
jgi:hypothetical protein